MPGQRKTSDPDRSVPMPREAGAPEAALRQTHFWITEHDLDILDTWVYHLRRGGWRSVNRSACVRAMIAALRDLPIERYSVTEESDLVEIIRGTIRNQHRQRD